MTPFMKAVRKYGTYNKKGKLAGWLPSTRFEGIYDYHQQEIWELIRVGAKADDAFQDAITFLNDKNWQYTTINNHADFCKAMVTAAAQVAGKGQIE